MWKQENPVSNTIKDTSTIMHTPLPELCRGGGGGGGVRMIVLVSLIVLLGGFPCFHDFSHGASLHPYSLHFNDFCTYSVESPIYSIRRFIKKRKVRTCRYSPK